MVKKANKKAEVTSENITKWVFGILGFAVVASILVVTLLGEDIIDRNVCHNSVILRATSPDIPGTNSKDITPLNCKTSRICVTNKFFGSGECQEDLGVQYGNERISSNIEIKENEIKKILSDEMASCWNTMGEGKVQVFSRELLRGRACVVCSRIALDESAKLGLPEIENFPEYLGNNNAPGQDRTYWEYLTNVNNQVDLSGLSEDVGLSLDEKAIVYMESNSGTFLTFGGGIVGGAVGSMISPTIGTGLGFAIGAKGGSELQKIWDGFARDDEYNIGVWLVDYDEDGFREIGCTSLESYS